MKQVLLSIVCLMLMTGVAYTQPGSIGLFSDPGGASPCLYELAPSLVTIYVVHVYSPGATASQFMVYCESEVALTYLGETSPYTTMIGNSQTGIAIAYEMCIASPNHILTINYYGQGLSAPCSRCRVVADPTGFPPGIYVADCDDPPNVLSATGGEMEINADVHCWCYYFVPAEDTSWGQIKSLYKQ